MMLPQRSGPYGVEVVLDRPWTPEVATWMRSHNPAGLHIGLYTTYKPESIEFVRTLPCLKSLYVSSNGVLDDSPIESIPGLRALRLNTDAQNPLDMRHFSSLESLDISWRRSISGLEGCQTLRRLVLEGYKPRGGSLAELAMLGQLRELNLAGGRIVNLLGLERLVELRCLTLCDLKIKSLNEACTLTQLKMLHIEGCRGINSLEPLSGLYNLIWLALLRMGDLESIEPIRSLKHLEVFIAAERSSIADGDLTPLVGLPCLKRVIFDQKRHYSHRLSSFPQDTQTVYENLCA